MRPSPATPFSMSPIVPTAPLRAAILPRPARLWPPRPTSDNGPHRELCLRDRYRQWNGLLFDRGRERCALTATVDLVLVFSRGGTGACDHLAGRGVSLRRQSDDTLDLDLYRRSQRDAVLLIASSRRSP